MRKMRLFIVGRVHEGNRIIAYKIYDADSKKTGLYTKENIYSRVQQGISVVGLFVKSDGLVTSLHGSFNVSKTDLLNGKGLPIKENGRYTLIAVSGFLESTEYKMVNSRGFQRRVKLDEFKALVEKDLVNGAIKSDKTKNNLLLYKMCNVREYWTEEENSSI